MYKKSGFSFLELLIVMMIVSVLFVAFRSSFEVKNKDTFYAQACVEDIYGQVNNFIHAGLSSKSLFDWTTAVFPDTYTISFQPEEQKIFLQYQQQESGYIYSSIEITGDSNTTYCVSNSYIMLLTWDTYELTINKWLQENIALQSFYLSGTTSVSTWANIFLQCTPEWLWCKKIGRFQTDTRTLSLQKQICLFINNEGECEERDN